jgi:hypothetical protein
LTRTTNKILKRKF